MKSRSDEIVKSLASAAGATLKPLRSIGGVMGNDGQLHATSQFVIFAELVRQQVAFGNTPLIEWDSDCSIRVHVDIPALMDAIERGPL